jgi:hypothetical protein
MTQNTHRILNSCGLVIAASGVNIYCTVQRNSIDYQAHPVASIIGSIIPGIIAGFAYYWWVGWRARRKERKLMQAGGDKFYDEVARELQEKTLVAGLWTKAYAEMGGDDAKARALYIKYRVSQLAEASHQRLEEERLERQRQEDQQRAQNVQAVIAKQHERQRQEDQQRAAMEAAKRQARTRFHRFIYWILGFASGLLTLILGFGGLGCLIEAFTERSGDSLAIEIVSGVICLFIAFCFGLATWHCYKETQ